MATSTLQDEIVSVNILVLRQNSILIDKILSYEKGVQILICPETEEFTKNCFLTCIEILGCERKENGYFTDAVMTRLEKFDEKQIILVSLYLQSESLLNYVCLEKLTTANFHKFFEILWNALGENHFLIHVLFRFVKTACDLNKNEILTAMTKGSLKQKVRNSTRLYYISLKNGLGNFPCKCPYCHQIMTCLEQQDPNKRAFPSTCCSSWFHIACQRKMLQSKYSVCNACNTTFFDNEIDMEMDTLDSVLTRRNARVHRNSPLYYRIKNIAICKPTSGLCNGKPP